MTTPIDWSWTASSDPSETDGEIKVSCGSHSLTFEMESFSRAAELIRLIEQVQARAQSECYGALLASVHEAIGKARCGL